jgi:hypothetical protein
MDLVPSAGPFSYLLQKGARAMRASTTWAIVAITILAISGCRSGTSYSPWNLGWGKKSSSGGAAPHASEAGPQLPSANAAPPNYGSTAQQSATPGYPDTGANAYPPASYPGQPAGYNGVQSAGIANAGAAGMPNATTPGYPAMPNTAPASATAPQSGPYNESYGPGAPDHPAGAGAAGYNLPPNGQGTPYPPASAYGQAAPSQNPASPASADPYASSTPASAGVTSPADAYPTAPSGGAYGSAPSDPYANQSPGGSRPADRYAAEGAQPEAAAADRYAAATNEPATSAAPPADRYQPGNTGYNPGQTGYSPPGVPPYQMPTQPNVVSTPRRDPYYRPGATSDYAPGAASSMATTPAADRYGAPAATASDPYATPSRY